MTLSSPPSSSSTSASITEPAPVRITAHASSAAAVAIAESGQSGSLQTFVAEELATISVLVRRDLTRFFRERSRVLGAVLQPLLFWLMIGSGMAGSFRLPGSEQVSYLEYFYPGVLVMIVLFSAIFTTMSVIEDRHSGFMQSVLVAPGSRVSLVMGKSLGSTLIAMIQGALFILLAPFAGFAFSNMAFVPLLGGLVLTSLALCTLGFAVAWWLDSTSAYHVVMSVVLLPLWILSGAMFPGRAGSVMQLVVRANPLSYAVAAVRRGVYGSTLPAGMPALSVSGTAALELGVLAVFYALALLFAVRVCQRLR
jgi:daunorubicin resistance ABC transporter membrane protein